MLNTQLLITCRPIRHATQPTSVAPVGEPLQHGASISPTKKEKSNFFDGELTDGQAIVRMVGFSQEQHDALEPFFEERAPSYFGQYVNSEKQDH